jgi:hypothetical protein
MPIHLHGIPFGRCSCHVVKQERTKGVEINISRWAPTDEGTIRKTPKPEAMQEGIKGNATVLNPDLYMGLTTKCRIQAKMYFAMLSAQTQLPLFRRFKGSTSDVSRMCQQSHSPHGALNALAIYLVGILDLRGSCISRDCLSILEPGEIECKSSKVGPAR